MANITASDLQAAATTGATASFSMTHKMGLAVIKMAGATAANSKETLTLNGNTSTTQYATATTNNAFYALDAFVTNLPYKIGSRNTSGLSCYFIVNPTKSYTFQTSYKYGDNDSYRQWNNFTISSSSNAIAGGKYKSITTSVPKFKNLGRLYSYTGSCQTYSIPMTNVEYIMECWGAKGANSAKTDGVSLGNYGGSGAYVRGAMRAEESGTINTMSVNQLLYIYVGGHPADYNLSANGGWNGGREGNNGSQYGYASGGATDIRLAQHTETSGFQAGWGGAGSMKTRIIVAAGGGGAGRYTDTYCGRGGAGGGVNGYDGYDGGSSWTPNQFCGLGASQTAGGKLGNGLVDGATGQHSTTNAKTNAENLNDGGFGYGGYNYGFQYISCGGGGGGSGWYGGGAANRGHGAGAGGSSFISGHPYCNGYNNTTNAHTGASRPSVINGTTYSFNINTLMIDGNGYGWTSSTRGSMVVMPNPSSANGTYASGAGHTGNGYARITCNPYD